MDFRVRGRVLARGQYGEVRPRPRLPLGSGRGYLLSEAEVTSRVRSRLLDGCGQGCFLMSTLIYWPKAMGSYCVHDACFAMNHEPWTAKKTIIFSCENKCCYMTFVVHVCWTWFLNIQCLLQCFAIVAILSSITVCTLTFSEELVYGPTIFMQHFTPFFVAAKWVWSNTVFYSKVCKNQQLQLTSVSEAQWIVGLL